MIGAVAGIILLLIFVAVYFLATGKVSGGLYDKLLSKVSLVDSDSVSDYKSSALLLLPGVGVFDDSRFSRVEPSMYAYGRLLAALAVYRRFQENGGDCHILISGKGAGVAPEADVYQKALSEIGVKKEHIILEGKSMDAWENAVFSSEIIKSMNKGCRVYIFDSGFHIPKMTIYMKRFFKDAVSVVTDSFYMKRDYSPSPLYFGYSLLFASEIFNIWLDEKLWWPRRSKDERIKKLAHEFRS